MESMVAAEYNANGLVTLTRVRKRLLWNSEAFRLAAKLMRELEDTLQEDFRGIFYINLAWSYNKDRNLGEF